MSRRAAEHRAQSLLRELEEEIAELKKRSTALSQLALSEDYIHFLKVWVGQWVNRMKQDRTKKYRSEKYCTQNSTSYAFNNESTMKSTCFNFKFSH